MLQTLSPAPTPPLSSAASSASELEPFLERSRDKSWSTLETDLGLLEDLERLDKKPDFFPVGIIEIDGSREIDGEDDGEDDGCCESDGVADGEDEGS